MKTNETRSARLLISLAALTLATASVHAQDNRSSQRRGPPQAAFDACADLAEGDVCSFSGRRGTAEGICEIPRRGETDALICAPENGGHRGDRPERKPDDEDADDGDAT